MSVAVSLDDSTDSGVPDQCVESGHVVGHGIQID